MYQDYEYNILFNEVCEFGLDVAERSQVVNKELAKQFVNDIIAKLDYLHCDLWPDYEPEYIEQWFADKPFAVDMRDNGTVIENLDQLLRMRSNAEMLEGYTGE